MNPVIKLIFLLLLAIFLHCNWVSSAKLHRTFRPRKPSHHPWKPAKTRFLTTHLLASVQPIPRRDILKADFDKEPIINWTTVENEELSIRTAKYDELSVCSRLLVREFYGRNFWIAGQIAAELARLQTNFHHDKSRHMMLLVEDENGEVCGYCDIDGRDVLPDAGLPQRPYLSDLAVSKEFRRRGIGTMLVQSCEHICRSWGFQNMYLKVDKNNLAAFNLYAKLGYYPASGFDERNQMLLCKDLKLSNNMPKLQQRQVTSAYILDTFIQPNP